MMQTPSQNAAEAPAQPRNPIGRLVNVAKAYPMGNRQYIALRGVDLSLYPGEFTAIVGPSGSGKSTILNMVTGIDRPTSGQVFMAGVPIHTLSENELAHWRGANVGIVFQFFQLLPTLTALENVMLPMDFLNTYSGKRQQRASVLLERVGLGGRGNHLPSELSGGEQQRVAIARAIANDPPILIADEPTGNLDTATGEHIMSLLKELSDQGKLVVFVTHDPTLAARAQRVIKVQDGSIVADEYQGGS
ncbi:MAG TPA: ABC transporter ATP-binding protein [Chloroflexia bacterium]|nr:ABC transporter ATP-binding protein [Chloroflexia bacterium]